MPAPHYVAKFFDASQHAEVHACWDAGGIQSSGARNSHRHGAPGDPIQVIMYQPDLGEVHNRTSWEGIYSGEFVPCFTNRRRNANRAFSGHGAWEAAQVYWCIGSGGMGHTAQHFPTHSIDSFLGAWHDAGEIRDVRRKEDAMRRANDPKYAPEVADEDEYEHESESSDEDEAGEQDNGTGYVARG